MDTSDIRTEMDRARADFRDRLDSATVAELRRPTDGTRWTNEQLLFHMLFGYLLVRNLLLLVRGFSRLPDRASPRFAATLNAGTRPAPSTWSTTGDLWAESASSGTPPPSG